jgi:c-di-GMP-binding flagellar brake protein YcgR
VTYPYERRRFRRVLLNLPAMIEVVGDDDELQSYPARILDISEGGMMLETREPVAVVGKDVMIQVSIGDQLHVHAKIRSADHIEVELSEDEEAGESIVRWADGNSGKFGVEFVNLQAEMREKLLKLLERAIASNGDVTKI